MPSQKFAFEKDGPERLEIAWDGGAFHADRNIRIYVEDELIASFDGPEILIAGWEKPINPDEKITVQIVGEYKHHFKVFYNGQEASQIFHTRKEAKSAYQFLFLFGGLQFVLGILSILQIWDNDFQPDSLLVAAATSLNIKPTMLRGGVFLFFGAIFLFFGYSVKEKKLFSLYPAIILALLFLIANLVIGSGLLSTIFLSFLLISVLINGRKAVLASSRT